MADKVCSVLVLPRALRGGNLIIPELIYPLSGIDAVAIRGGQGIGNIPLPAEAVSTVLWLAVNGVARDADDFLRYLLNKLCVQTTRTHSGRKCWRYLMGACVAAVYSIVFIQ